MGTIKRSFGRQFGIDSRIKCMIAIPENSIRKRGCGSRGILGTDEGIRNVGKLHRSRILF